MSIFQTKADLKPIKYGQLDNEFYSLLKKRVEHYFTETKQSRFANAEMQIKTIVLVVLLLGTYTLFISNVVKGPLIIVIQIIFHLLSFIMWIGIAHDAHHDAFTANKKWNKLLLFLGDLTGVSSYVMDYNHVKAHHTSVNVPDYDVSIDSFGIMRFHPDVPWKWFHRYQHLYIWIIYSISSLFKLFIFDFFTLKRNSIGSFKIRQHPWYQKVYMLLMKSFTLFYSVLLPILILDTPKHIIIIGFLVGHMISGALLGLVFQVTHLCDYSLFTDVDETDHLKNSFAIHVTENTSTFSPNNKWMSWLTGGLNHHTIHHIFPNICQSHFYYLTPILRETAKEMGVPFKEYPSFWSAIQSHYCLLKKLGASQKYRSVPFTSYQLKDRYELIYK
jgi:linoleoyl-CoA desaturase